MDKQNQPDALPAGTLPSSGSPFAEGLRMEFQETDFAGASGTANLMSGDKVVASGLDPDHAAYIVFATAAFDALTARSSLATVLDMARAHTEDIESGLEEHLYEEADNRDLPEKLAAVDAITEILPKFAPRAASAQAVNK